MSCLAELGSADAGRVVSELDALSEAERVLGLKEARVDLAVAVQRLSEAERGDAIGRRELVDERAGVAVRPSFQAASHATNALLKYPAW